MTWDQQKQNFETRANINGDEKLPADEWNAHVADQKSRVKYGPLADRPAAGDVPDGTVWLVTDLANDGGVLTEVVNGSWVIKSLGDSSNRIPNVFADTFDGNIVDAGQLLNVSAVGLTNNTEISTIGTAINSLHRYTHTTLPDGQAETLGPDQGVIFVRAVDTDVESDAAVQAGISLYNEGSGGEASIIWDPVNNFSTTQGNAQTLNVFYDAEYLLENQTGTEVGVSIHRIS